MGMAANGLVKLLEELGELSQIAAKKLAYYDTDEHPDGNGSIKKRIEDEMADVLAAIDFSIAAHGLDEGRILDRAEAKLALFKSWAGEIDTQGAD